MEPKPGIRNSDLETGISPCQVLLVEDNPTDALLLREMLAEVASVRLVLTVVGQFAEALACLQAERFDAVLLDLSLPDSTGLDTVIRVQEQAPDVPLVVLTGHDDETLAVQTLQQGAQDYLVKGQVDRPLLERALRYAIERQRLLAELEKTRQREQEERELRSWEQISTAPPTTVTAHLLGLAPLRESVPDTWAEWGQRYEELLEQALQQRIYKVAYPRSADLRALAEQMGSLKAGPRDVVEMHSTALKNKGRGATPQKMQAYLEEGRLLVLELMGDLVSYYRHWAFGVPGNPAPEAREHRNREPQTSHR